MSDPTKDSATWLEEKCTAVLRLARQVKANPNPQQAVTLLEEAVSLERWVRATAGTLTKAAQLKLEPPKAKG